MERKRELNALVEECIAYLQKNGFSENRIADYKGWWKKGIENYMKEHSLQLYDTEVGDSYIKVSQIRHRIGMKRREEVLVFYRLFYKQAKFPRRQHQRFVMSYRERSDNLPKNFSQRRKNLELQNRQ